MIAICQYSIAAKNAQTLAELLEATVQRDLVSAVLVSLYDNLDIDHIKKGQQYRIDKVKNIFFS